MAVLSLMARLGSSDPIELRSSVQEIVDGFRIESFGAAPTKFDAEDLWPLTARVIAAKPLHEVAHHVAKAGVPGHLAEAFWHVVKDNIGTIEELADWWKVFAEGALALVDPEDAEFAEEALALLPEPPYNADNLGAWTEAVKLATGRKGKALFMPRARS